MKLQATAIICAYNEENTISNILKEVCELHYFNEVVVINDGSTDKTGKLIKSCKKTFNITDVHLLVNMGKGYAMAKGSEIANNEYLVFIDADLSNFSLTHARKLLNPVLGNEANMVLGYATKTIGYNPFKKLSGQRALKKQDIMPILKKMETSGYGVETLINMHFTANHKTVSCVALENLGHPTKFQKVKPHEAIREFFMEGCQILTTIFTNISMRAKSNKNRLPINFNI